ncbi:hypothetical protein BKA82DRAFT_158153 [Pisolithus tinctorius]|nr:hypothetical protein BKA82DRAFT_158153 [Pisolithus tinctorius]
MAVTRILGLSYRVRTSIFLLRASTAQRDVTAEEEPAPGSTHVNFQVSVDNPAYPWPSKAHFLTELLFSSPRLPFSEPQKRAILSWAKELGARDIPSLYSLNRCHEEIKNLIGNPTRKVVSASGNIFYINDIANSIAKDYANLLTRFAMQDFPEDGGEGMSQVFNGGKLLHELPSPPAVRVDGTVYFVDELLQEYSGDYFFPERFFLAAPEAIAGGATGFLPTKAVYALGRAATRTEAGFIISDEREIIPTASFRRSFEEISRCPSELACGLTESSKKSGSLCPNVWRRKSGGWMVYNVPLIIFMDDVSGNISKQWNKHHVIYVTNANLPREMLEQEFYVRFMTSSPHAAPMELMHAMKESISNVAESGIIAWDCRDEEEVMLIPQVLFLAGDNPMQGEECSQAGLSCNHFCRTCDVGGKKEHKESDAGYCSLFKSGNLRTVNTIKEQFSLAMLSGATEKVKTSVSTTGVRDSISLGILNTVIELGKSLRKRRAGTSSKPESEVREVLEKELAGFLQGRVLEDAINPLLGMKDVNIHLDTPTEILHTILLGVVKYFWGQTVFLLEKANLVSTFQSRLDAIDRDGLNAPSLNAEYICRYKGGLIGKHFKSLAQVMPFVIHDLVPQRVMDGWTSIGELVVLLWHTKIDNTDEYLARLSWTIEDFLNVTCICAPSILISKPKFHFLVHLPMYIRRFGPALLFSTECYESYNHVFRLSCIHSSRHGPSQDSCRKFARLDQVKHILTGGFWYEPRLQKWVQAAPAVLDFLSEHPEHARLLGIKFHQGTGHITRIKGTNGKTEISKAVHWKTTQCAQIDASLSAPDQYVYQADSFISKHSEKVKLGSHVIFLYPKTDSGFSVGRIIEVLIRNAFHRNVVHVAIQVLSFSALHPLIHLPCLELSDDKIVVSPDDVICVANVQHNCVDSKCASFVNRAIRQERSETTQVRKAVRHEPTRKYLLNTYSIHNYAHIRRALPPSLRQTPLRVLDDIQHTRCNAAQQHERV